MATIQIRDIPDEAYAVVQRRAREQGRSLQSLMRAWVVEWAGRPTVDEALASLRALQSASDTRGATRESVLADLSADRR